MLTQTAFRCHVTHNLTVLQLNIALEDLEGCEEENAELKAQLEAAEVCVVCLLCCSVEQRSALLCMRLVLPFSMQTANCFLALVCSPEQKVRGLQCLFAVSCRHTFQN